MVIHFRAFYIENQTFIYRSDVTDQFHPADISAGFFLYLVHRFRNKYTTYLSVNTIAQV